MSQSPRGPRCVAQAAVSVLVAFALVRGGQAVADELKLSFPVDCQLGVTCFIQNYVDIDPGPGARDYRCGRATYDGHKGTDFRLLSVRAAETGVDVLAAAPGIVKALRDGMPDRLIAPDRPTPTGRECGNGVVLDHGAGWETQYCHLRRGSLRVSKGDHVTRGAVLGEIGYSGKTEFAHLHLSVRRGDAVIDPFTGKTPGAACLSTRRSASSLWSGTLDLPYEQGELVQTGFTDAAMPTRAMEDGSVETRGFTAKAPAAIFFARFINLQKGDRVRLRLTGPGGLLADSISTPLVRAKAQLVRFTGRKRRSVRWPKGVYVGTVWLLRNGEIISQRRAQTNLSD